LRLEKTFPLLIFFVAKNQIRPYPLRMSNTEHTAATMITTPSQLLSMALGMGNMVFAKIIANSPEYIAEVEDDAIAFHNRPKAPIDTTAADNVSKRSGFDFEGAILARNERILHSI